MIQIFGNSIPMAEKALDFLWSKQQVHSANLANVDTPGYKTKYVTFEETFRSKLKNAAVTGNRGLIGNAIESARWEVNDTRNETSRLDGNNVDADVEMVEVTRAALQYQYLLYSINSDHHRLQSVIKGQ
ncbi:MAG: flagellar basal body rod protein FlgB [Firmicutes bacterium]|nr:flagellar basal body rod protein FlgB [Bacillota bacterium]